MKVICHSFTRPSFNLAVEEYLLKHTEDDYFMLWRNERSIIVGRNQNTHAEVNSDFVREISLPVIRRLTGGGAVFHDLGNLNYTFITRSASENFNNYAVFAAPVIAALKKLGCNAELSGRNDMLVDGRKFSGNAQCMHRGAVMHHGTLMFDADVSSMSEALNVNPLKISSKGIKSVRSRVTNLAQYLPSGMTVEALAKAIADEVRAAFPFAEDCDLTEDDVAAIRKLEEEKYATWEWNYGFRREFTHRDEKYFPFGLVEAQLTVEDDIIRSVRFFGDYFGRRDVSELEKSLTGIRYRPEDVLCALRKIQLCEYFTSAEPEDILSVMM